MNIDLIAPWNTFWGALTSATGGQTFQNVLAVIGVVLILIGAGTWAWQKRKGGGGDNKKFIMSIIIGVVLAAPLILIPIALGIIQIVIRVGANIIQVVTGT